MVPVSEIDSIKNVEGFLRVKVGNLVLTILNLRWIYLFIK